MNAQAQSSTLPELTIRRNLAAPRALVYRAWTDGEHLRRWCCPTGFTIPYSEGDIRPGGAFRTCMRSPDGTDHWLGGRYLELIDNERIVFTHAWQDAEGRSDHATTVTITLADASDGGTRLTLHQAFFTTVASRDGHESGWIETLDQLVGYLLRSEIA